MKHYPILFLISVAMMLSCRKENRAIINFEKVNEVISSKPVLSSRTSLLAVLNEAEKAYLWKTHLETFLQVSSLNDEQKNILTESIAFITPSVFLESNLEGLKGRLAELEFKARNAFSVKNYYVIFEIWDTTPAQLDNNDPLPSLPAPGGIGGDGCYCRSDSYCQRVAGSDLAGCLWNICTPSNGGCGLFGLHDCKGRCHLGSIVY